MKGIAHFLTGVALATCLPQVVALAREGSLLPVLGGVGGLLPDLLDFRFVRYFDHYDAEIDPGPVHDDVAALQAAESIAEALVRALCLVFETGRPFRVITHTVQMGRDLWRRYTVSFVSASDAGMGERGGRLYVRLGPLVNTNGIDLPGSELGAPVVERSLAFDLVAPYDRDYVIDGFTGPTFTFTRESDRLVVNFLDWHHRWTHSLLLAVAAGAVIGVLGALTAGPAVGWLSGILTLLGYAAHVLEDQLGHMGCNLCGRSPGVGCLASGCCMLERRFPTSWLSGHPWRWSSITWIVLGGQATCQKYRSWSLPLDFRGCAWEGFTCFGAGPSISRVMRVPHCPL